MRGSFLSTACFALLPFLAAGNILRPRDTACNNSPDLCSKAYDEITHLGAHDSPFVRDSSDGDSSSGNQNYKTPIQLDAGVRLVTGQVHKSGSEWHLCHSNCKWGMDSGKLSDWLSDIKKWLDGNPNDVVTLLLVNSDNAAATDLQSEFKTAGIDKYAYQPSATTSPPTSWPTLQDLINKNSRLVTFVASLSDNKAAPYLLDEFTFVWETPYDIKTPANFSCTPDRPQNVKGNLKSALSSNRLPLMNHFLYQTSLMNMVEMPNTSYVSTTNGPSGGEGNLGAAADKCKSAYKRQPTFILVDFFEKGPAIQTVDKLNNVTNAVGRKDPKSSSESSSASSNGNVFKGLVNLANSVKSGANPGMGEWVWAGGDWGSLGGISLG